MRMPQFISNALDALTEAEKDRLLERVEGKVVPGTGGARLQPRLPGEGIGVPMGAGPSYSPPAIDEAPPKALVKTNASAPTYRAPATETLREQLTGKPYTETLGEQLTGEPYQGPAGVPPPQRPTGPDDVFKYDPVTTPVPTYDAKGRPTGVEGGGTQQEQNQAYLRALQSYKPEDRNGRLKSILIGAGRTFARGGSPIMGAVESAIDPATDERYAHNREINRVGNAVESDLGIQKATADNAYHTAQAERLRNPVYEPDLVDTEGDGLVTVDKTTRKVSPVYRPGTTEPLKKKVTPKDAVTKVFYNEKTGKAETWTVNRETGLKEKMLSPSDPHLDLVNHNGRWVSPNADVMATATERREATAAEERGERKQERIEDKTDKGIEKFQTIKEKSGALIGKITGARTKWMAADAKVIDLQRQIAAEADPERKKALEGSLEKWSYEKTTAAQEAAQAATELNSAHGDIYEAGVGEGGLAYYKAKPFSVAQWRAVHKDATPAQEAKVIANAKELGMKVIK